MNDSHVMTLSDGRDLGWTEFGNPDGWPVFGFHGTPGSRLQMGLNEAAACRADVRLIAPDRPGYGLSTFQPCRRLIDWPDDVRQLADHLGVERFSVVGVSGGGPHAAACASLLARRVVAAGIVSGVGPLSDARISVGETRVSRFLSALFRRRSRMLRTFFIIQAAVARRWPTRALDLMIKQLPQSDADVLRRSDLLDLFERDVTRAPRTVGPAQAEDLAIASTDWGFDLGEITVPVFLWQGEADRNVPPLHAQVMHENIPGSILRTYAGEGHLLVADRLEEILIALKPS